MLGPARDNGDGASTREAAEVVELDRAEAMRPMASVGYGRVVFTQGALPAIRTVNHLVDGGRVIVRTRLTAELTTAIAPSAHVPCRGGLPSRRPRPPTAGGLALSSPVWPSRSPTRTRSPATNSCCIHGCTRQTPW